MSMVIEAIADMYQGEIDALRQYNSRLVEANLILVDKNLRAQEVLGTIYLDGMRNHRVRCMPWWKQLTELTEEFI